MSGKDEIKESVAAKEPEVVTWSYAKLVSWKDDNEDIQNTYRSLGNAIHQMYSPSFNTNPGLANCLFVDEKLTEIFSTWREANVNFELIRITHIDSKFWKPESDSGHPEKMEKLLSEVAKDFEYFQTSYHAWLEFQNRCTVPSKVKTVIERKVVVPDGLPKA